MFLKISVGHFTQFQKQLSNDESAVANEQSYSKEILYETSLLHTLPWELSKKKV